MAKVYFKRKTTQEIEELPVEDGSLIYNTDNGKTYMDFNDERIQTGGNADTMIAISGEEPTDTDVKIWIQEKNNQNYDTFNYRKSTDNKFSALELPPTGDTLPIGSIIYFDGDTVPTNYELVDDSGEYKKIKKVAQSVGVVGAVTKDINDTNDNAVPNAKTVKEYVDDNTNKASKIVWNNPNPTSDFSTQEITLDSSFANYNAYEIVYKGWKGNLQMASTGIVPKTTGAIMHYLESSTVLGLRQSKASVNNKMNIGNASGTGMNNAYIIPQMVIAHYIKEM